MMTATICLVLWFGCGVLGYVFFRRDCRRKFGRWTVGDRRAGLAMVPAGFGFLFASLFVWWMDQVDSDKTASW